MANETDHDETRLTDLYREGAAEQPPAELDAAILDAARSELRAPSRRRYRPTAAQAFATAAVVVIAIGIVTLNPTIIRQAVEPEIPQVLDADTTPSALAPPTDPAPTTTSPAPELVIEEIVATGSRVQEPEMTPEQSLQPAPEAAPIEGIVASGKRPARDLMSAPETRVTNAVRLAPLAATQASNGYAIVTTEHDLRVYAEECRDAYTLAVDALVSKHDVGVVVKEGEDRFLLQCLDGRWSKEPLSEEFPVIEDGPP